MEMKFIFSLPFLCCVPLRSKTFFPFYKDIEQGFSFLLAHYAFRVLWDLIQPVAALQAVERKRESVCVFVWCADFIALHYIRKREKTKMRVENEIRKQWHTACSYCLYAIKYTHKSGA